MKALVAARSDHTRFDVPAYDETRIDSLRSMGPRASATAVLAPPAARPRGWAEDTSLDHFADLDLTDEPVPAAFTRTLERPTPSRTTTPPPGARSAAAAAAAATAGSGWRSAPSPSSPRARSAAC